MAKKKSVNFPSADLRFSGGFNELMAYLAVLVGGVMNYVRLGIDETSQYDLLTDILAKWNVVIIKEKNKGVKSGNMRVTKDKLKKQALAIIRPMRMQMKANEKAAPGFLLDEDKNVFFIVDSTPRSSGIAPTETPQVTIDGISHLEHVLRIVDILHPDTKALPEDAWSMEVLRFIGFAPPTDNSQYSAFANSGKFRVVSTFNETDGHKICWYIARYLSYTGKPGAFSAPVCVTIAAIALQPPKFPTPTPVPTT